MAKKTTNASEETNGKNIVFNSEIFNLIKDLSSINNSIIFEKNDGKVLITRSDSEKTIVYRLETPMEYFDFNKDEIAFYNYNEFYQFLTVFRSPTMLLEGNKIILSEGESKFNYIIQNPEAITSPRPKKPNFNDPDVEFVLDANTLDEISKMNALIKAKHAKIFGNGETINIRLFNNLHDNSFDKKISVKNLTNFDNEFDFNIFTDIFTKIPLKRDYKVSIKKEGFVKMSLVDENISLDIYTAFIRNNASSQ
jgi:hypothetical protein